MDNKCMNEDGSGFKNCWLAYFDILGFRQFVETASQPWELLLVRTRHERALKALQAISKNMDKLDYAHFSDTFIIFSSDDSKQSYIVIQEAAKYFIEKCITIKVPIRGAISLGLLTDVFNKEEKILIGPALIDAYDYGENQEWIGLILTKKASNKRKELNVNDDYTLEDADFMKDDFRKKHKIEKLYAYNLSRGRHNRESHLLPSLKDMKQQAINLIKKSATEEQREKYQKIIKMYERAEEHINKHYKHIDNAGSSL